MFDLFGSANKVKAVEKQVLEQSRAMSDGSLNQTPPMDMFPAKLTAYDSATGYYSWTEQYYTTTGVRQDRVGGRTGTHTWMPAKMLNGAKVTTFPFQVTLIRTIHSDTLGVIYEALAGLPFEEMDLIDKICVTKNSGVVTDINIQRRTYLVAAVLPEPNESTCTTGDDDCCPYVTVACCPNPISKTLTASFSNGTSDCTCFDGQDFELTYNGVCPGGTCLNAWECRAVFCGQNVIISLQCVASTWQFTIYTESSEFPDVCSIDDSTTITDDCDPFYLEMTLTNDAGNCCSVGGTLKVIVTE